MGELCLVTKNEEKRNKNRRTGIKKMGKYIQKKVKTEKTTQENSGKTLYKNVEIPYNIKRDNETQHLTRAKTTCLYLQNRMPRTFSKPAKI